MSGTFLDEQLTRSIIPIPIKLNLEPFGMALERDFKQISRVQRSGISTSLTSQRQTEIIETSSQ